MLVMLVMLNEKITKRSADKTDDNPKSWKNIYIRN